MFKSCNYFFIYSLMLISPSVVMASSSVSSIGVKMKVTHASCTINSGKGMSGLFNLPVMNDSGRIVDKINYTDVPLIIDCTKGVKLSALNISFSSASPGFQDPHDGLLKTTDPDILLQTRWRRNGERIIDFSGVTDMLAIKSFEVSAGIYDTSLKVYPLTLNPGGMSLTPGSYHADLTINIVYY